MTKMWDESLLCKGYERGFMRAVLCCGKCCGEGREVLCEDVRRSLNVMIFFYMSYRCFVKVSMLYEDCELF